MSERERIRRPQLSRTKPIREWSTLFGNQEEAGPQKPPADKPREQTYPSSQHDQPGSRQQTGAAQHTGENKQPGLEDAVARSVDLGYKVVDDYLRRGQEAAQRMRAGTYGTSALVQDARDVAERMVRGASDLMGAWAELLELTATSNGAPEPGPQSDTMQPTRSQGRHQTVPGETSAWRVRVRVESVRPVEVSVDVDSPLDGQDVVVHSLRAADSGQERIDDVAYELADDGMPVIKVRVGDDIPAGRYRGTIVDGRSGRSLGSLSIAIDDA